MVSDSHWIAVEHLSGCGNVISLFEHLEPLKTRDYPRPRVALACGRFSYSTPQKRSFPTSFGAIFAQNVDRAMQLGSSASRSNSLLCRGKTKAPVW
jgi:hypothetical protein